MSKMSLRFYLSLLVVYMLPGVLYAQHGDSYYTVGATIDGLKYNLNEQTHTAMVASHNSWEGELAIPEEIVYEGESYVTEAIVWNAFSNCTTLTRVKIPKTILGIRSYWYQPGTVRNPFSGCINLEYIEVDEENSNLSSIDGALLSKDGANLYSYPVGSRAASYVIPDDVTWIAGYCFSQSPYMQTVEMPNSVTTLGSSAFSGCKALTHVRISESLKVIDSYTFESCENLHFLDIPESVGILAEDVFRYTPLEVIVIRGTFSGEGLAAGAFSFLSSSATLYVQSSEIEEFKKVFSGKVLPLEDYTSNIATAIQQDITADDAFFDIMGRRVGQGNNVTEYQGNKLPKGIYIQNGRKFVVK